MPECSLRLDFAALAAWRDGFTPARRAAQIAAHVGACAACQAHLTTLATMAQALRRDDRDATSAPPWQPRMWHAMQTHMAQAQQQGTAMQRGVHRRDGRMTWGGVATVLAFTLVLALVASRYAALPGAATRWRTDTLPKTDRAYFSISQEVPGLAYAVTGNNKGDYDYPPFDPLQGTLWRTQDGGVHWEPVSAHPTFSAASQPQVVLGNHSALAITDNFNGKTFFSANVAAGNSQFRIVNQGGNFMFARPNGLYSFSRGTPSSLWHSSDGGQTWEEIPQQAFATVTSIAPDYRTAVGGWYRTVHYPLYDVNDENPIGAVRIEHSTDDGVTWQAVQTITIPAIAAPNNGDAPMAALATNPAFPSRLCVAFGINDDSLSTNQQPTTAQPIPNLQTIESGMVPLTAHPGLFPRTPEHLFIAGTDSQGHISAGVEIGQSFAGRGSLTAPGVILDDRGVCDALVTPSLSSSRTNSELWSLTPSSGHATMQTIAGLTTTQFAVTPDDSGWRLTIAAYTSHPVSICYVGGSCPDPFAYPTHLMWHDLP